jgi:hypothetical protein
VPFPTLFRTLADLDEVWHRAVLIIVADLSVLVVHLVAYPWPRPARADRHVLTGTALISTAGPGSS